jgi:hypothetical protein
MKDKSVLCVAMNHFLAEIIPQGRGVLDAAQVTSMDAVVGLLFLCILLVGIALDAGLVVYCLKRPQRPQSWAPAIAAKALGELGDTSDAVLRALEDASHASGVLGERATEALEKLEESR